MCEGTATEQELVASSTLMLDGCSEKKNTDMLESGYGGLGQEHFIGDGNAGASEYKWKCWSLAANVVKIAGGGP